MKEKNRNVILLCIVILVLLISSCNTFRTKSKPDIAESNILYATLYNYYSAEYKALALQAYNLASERIKSIRKADPENDSLAVVLDLDETVLDNSPYQAILI
ncbi:MAG: HAD family acid phosphatase, partial [Bacteroidales bacterium]